DDIYKIGNKKYNDQLTFFKDCCGCMTLYGSVIVKTDSMLSGVDWEKLKKKYNVPDKVYFSHVCFYFERILMLKEFNAKRYSFNSTEIAASFLKISSGWVNDFFKVWLIAWTNSIKSIPEYYDSEKDYVIKHFGMITPQNLKTFRRGGYINKKTYDKYADRIENSSMISKMELKKICLKPRLLVNFKEKINNILNNINVIRRLFIFSRKFDYVYIMGNDRVITNYYKYLELLRIKIRGYIRAPYEVCITDNRDGYKIFPDKTVNDTNAGIVLEMNLKYFNELKKIDYFNDFKERIFSEYMYIH
nr:hypothetical protein [Lachnospiraceae bacterium]